MTCDELTAASAQIRPSMLQQTDIQTDRETDRQTYIQTDRQTRQLEQVDPVAVTQPIKW